LVLPKEKGHSDDEYWTGIRLVKVTQQRQLVLKTRIGNLGITKMYKKTNCRPRRHIPCRTATLHIELKKRENNCLLLSFSVNHIQINLRRYNNFLPVLPTGKIAKCFSKVEYF
jgi:hypothetical protein